MSEGDLDGKVALVTGAASGIGRSAAVLFAQQGARVVLADRNRQGLEETLQEIHSQSGDGHIAVVDLSELAAVSAMVADAVLAYKTIDVLFNVAGGSARRWGDGPAAECTEEAWDQAMLMNVKTQFLCCKYVLQVMLAAGSGSIINLSSVLALVGDEDFATHAYAASKGAVISLTRSIAAYYASRHIRANVICPGLIATPMSRRAQSDEHILGRLAALQPLTADFGQPQDVSQAALFLASERSRFVTGAVLAVDGGWTVH